MYLEKYIGIAGIIGVGKSTLTTKLSKALNYKPIYEPVETNPYLEDFYKDPAKYGAIMQIFLLNARYRQMKQFTVELANNALTGVVQDRTIWEDTIFAEMLFEQGKISRRDYDTYLNLFSNMVLRDMIFPQTLVYLQCRPSTALERIKQRARGCEVGVTLEYLTDLHEHYQTFLRRMSDCGVDIVCIPYDDFLSVPKVIELMQLDKYKENPFARMAYKH